MFSYKIAHLYGKGIGGAIRKGRKNGFVSIAVGIISNRLLDPTWIRSNYIIDNRTAPVRNRRFPQHSRGGITR